jgi:hypothetical protein
MKQSVYRIRRDIGRLSLSLLFVLGLVPAFASQQDSAAHSETLAKPYVDPDAYAIYAILLASENRSSFVIQAETESRPQATPGNVGIKGGSSFYKVWGSALKDYAKQFRNPRLLTRNFPDSVPYELVPKQKIDAINKSGKNWDELYPSSRGYYWFSAVGFDPSRTRAIVSMNNLCGGLCGGGGPYFFEKTNDKWRKVSVNAEVIFWAS